ncbi:hypothetical protein LTR53_005284 [Teratosphaeriaceae sp. CCFEE 6253]|nr:hypothetical protein LTR53_005284 [Teratosphaeriaceae sp. CCFEE 6253]
MSIHKGVIRPRSAFLNDALQGGWAEGAAKKALLPDAKPDMVMLYIRQLYTGDISLEKTTTIEVTRPTDDLPDYSLLAELYIFGENVHETVFQITAMADVCARGIKKVGSDNWSPVGKAVDNVYRVSPAEVPSAWKTRTRRSFWIRPAHSGGEVDGAGTCLEGVDEG